MSLLALAFAAALHATQAYRVPSDLALDAVVQAPWSGDEAGLSARIVDVTAPFVGAPYVLSPLGEGEGHAPDADPRFRADAFDCTTFVETALALAFAHDLAEGRRLLDVIRYRGGMPAYLARRHFPEAEWIPELKAAGFLVDITRAIGGADVVVQSKHLDAKVWHRAHHDGLPPLPDARIPVGDFALDVWPLAAARAHLDRIPPGTLLHVVRVDFGNVPVRVSHQGLVIDKGGTLYLRHAADRMYHSVVDEPLAHFAARMAQYGRWPVAGFHLTRIAMPADLHARAPSSTPTAAPDAAPVTTTPGLTTAPTVNAR